MTRINADGTPRKRRGQDPVKATLPMPPASTGQANALALWRAEARATIGDSRITGPSRITITMGYVKNRVGDSADMVATIIDALNIGGIIDAELMAGVEIRWSGLLEPGTMDLTVASSQPPYMRWSAGSPTAALKRSKTKWAKYAAANQTEASHA